MSIILTRPQPNIVMPDGAWMGRTANGPKVAFDDTNNYLEITGCKVGIVTTAPGYELDVTGDANITGTYRVNGAPISATANWTLSGDDLYYTTGKVGIGTTGPTGKLHIYGSSATPPEYDDLILETYLPGFQFRDRSITSNDSFRIQGNANKLTIQSDTDLDFDYDNSLVAIQSTGNVGIGTTEPSNLVHAVTNPATTNTVVDVLRLDRTTSGTAAAGIGCGIVLYAEDASANIEEAANIDAVFTTAAHATQVGELRLGVMGTNIVTIDSKKNVVLAPAAIATDATDGFTYIPTCAGAPTGVPTAKTGTVALVFDTTNNKLYIYDGGWLNVTLAA